MTTNTIEVAGDLLTASVEDRVLTYKLLPYTHGNTSAGRVLASEGCLTLPDNPADVVLNDRHISDRRLGQGKRLSWEADALVAAFTIDHGPAGDALLDEAVRARNGAPAGVELRRGVSVEVGAPVIRAGRLLGGLLKAAGAVVRPAFPDATLLAADAGEFPDEVGQPSESESSNTWTDTIEVNGVTYRRVSTSTTTNQTTVEVIDGDPDAAPADDDTQQQEDTTMTETVTASAPADLVASRRETPKRPKIETPRAMAQLLAAYHSNRSSELLDLLRSPEVDGGDLFAALTDIKWDGTGGLSQTITQPQWLGNVWAGRRFQRRYIPLMLQDSLTSLALKGWTWGTKPVMAPWNGNKSAVPSGTVTAVPVTATATRYAGAHDIAREFRDFSNAEFWEAYFAAMTDSYAENTDEAALTAIVTAATDVTPGTVPTDVPDALAYIVDGVLAMPKDASASYAIVAPDLWRDLVLTPTDKALEFLSASLNLEDAEGVFDRFKIVAAHADDDFPAGSVLVGAREASTSQELPGAPIRVEAENIANGGIDEGMFGYHGVTINNAAALALVAPVTP